MANAERCQTDRNPNLREIFTHYSWANPFDILCADIRIKGIRTVSEASKLFVRGKRGTLQLENNDLMAVIGVRHENNSPYSYDGQDIFYGNQSIIDNYNTRVFKSVKPSSRLYKPDFYWKARDYKGRLNERAVLNLNLSQTCKYVAAGSRCLFCNRRMGETQFISKKYIERILSAAALTSPSRNLERVEQISIVTGIHEAFTQTVGVLNYINKIAKQYGFNGQIMFAGTGLNLEDILFLKEQGVNLLWNYTIESFSRRKQIMPNPKSEKSIQDIVKFMKNVKAILGKASYFYIIGLDRLDLMRQIMERMEFCNPAPTAQIFDISTQRQKDIADPDFSLDYVLRVAQIIKDIYGEPDRGCLDGSRGFWTPLKGVMLGGAYILRENLPEKFSPTEYSGEVEEVS